MMPFTGRGIVLDIEGTVAPVSYVTEVLFPYAKKRLTDFLARRWDDPAVVEACAQVARDAAAASLAALTGTDQPEAQRAALVAHLEDLMSRDAKATGLKALQGLIWEEGFHAGELKSTLYPDVPAVLRRWHAAGAQLRIYSSGSVAAQKVFFAHTQDGDLTPLFSGYHDTTTGPKREAVSYQRIAQAMGLPPEEILFVSDIVAELDAARAAGLLTALAVRPGNAPSGDPVGHPVVHSLEEVRLGSRA